MSRIRRNAGLTAAVAVAVMGMLAAAPVAAALHETEHDHSSANELKAFDGARISLQDAVQSAEKQGKGRAVDAMFQAPEAGGKPHYRVKVLSENRISQYDVDPINGHLSMMGKPDKISSLDEEDRAEVSAAQNAKLSLSQAAAEAEKQIGGKAIDTGMERRQGQIAYEAHVVKDGSVHRVMIDPGTGSVTTPSSKAPTGAMPSPGSSGSSNGPPPSSTGSTDSAPPSMR